VFGAAREVSEALGIFAKEFQKFGIT